MVRLIIEEKLKSNITRSGPIIVMPYLRGTFKVFIGEIYLVVDMKQRTCTCMTLKMSEFPCVHAYAIIYMMRHHVYEYVNPCYHVST